MQSANGVARFGSRRLAPKFLVLNPYAIVSLVLTGTYHLKKHRYFRFPIGEFYKEANHYFIKCKGLTSIGKDQKLVKKES